MTKVFITGATGYIGGDVVSQLQSQHPEMTIRLVKGDLSDIALLQEESANADIIIHSADAADNVPAATAIAAGIVQGHTLDKPAYWVHISAAGVFSYHDEDEMTYGLARDKIFNDWDGIQEILNMPDHAFHRDVDKIVLEATAEYPDVIRAAIVSPNTTYGVGPGPCSRRSRQVYELAKTTLARGKAPYIGAGESYGCNIHIHDVTDLIMLLFDAALTKANHLWGAEAYYLAENGEDRWSDVAPSIADIAVVEGYLSHFATEQLEFEEAKRQAGYEAASWGLNVRCRAVRARKLMQWVPSKPGLDEELPSIVRGEWELLDRT